jgi:hypothetical protein
MGRKKMSDAARIRAYYEKNPDAKPKDVAIKLNVSPTSVYLARSKMKAAMDAIYKAAAVTITTPAEEKWKTVTMNIANQAIDVAAHTLTAADPVNHPPHYKTGGIETIDFIEAKGLNYRMGNVIKYITRADHKGNRKEDLQKALWYLQREIEKA